MKKIAIMSLCTALLTGNVFAATVSVPFLNKAVPTQGLMISYSTEDTEKVVCIADNFYKGYLYVTENGSLKDTSMVIGNYDGSEFYFTSVGSDNLNRGVEQLHVDKKGSIMLRDTNYKPHKSYVSCFYVPETVTK